MKFFHFIHSPFSEVFHEETTMCKKNYFDKEDSVHLSIIDAKTTSPKSVLEKLSTPSLLQQDIILCIQNYSSFKEADLHKIWQQNVDKYIFFVEESATPPPGFVEKFCKQHSAESKIIYKPYGLPEREIQTWILNYLRTHNINISEAGKKLLLHWGYEHPERIAAELQKLACYIASNPAETISEVIIQNLFPNTQKILPFALEESIFAGNGTKSLQLLCEYALADPHTSGAQKYLGIVSLLLKECNLFLDFIKENSQGNKPESILAKYQVRGKKRTDKILFFANKFSKHPTQLHKIAIWLANLEVFLKSESAISSSFGYCIPSTLFFQKMILSCREE